MMYDLAIIVIRLPAGQVVRFQGMLDGEDGLATLRCRDAARNEQQIWTTQAQLNQVRSWILSLPDELQVEVGSVHTNSDRSAAVPNEASQGARSEVW